MTVQVSKNSEGLFQITAYIPGPAMDDLFDVVTYSGHFTVQSQAQRIAKKIAAALDCNWNSISSLNLNHWLWTPSKTAGHAELRTDPIAKTWIVGQDPLPT